MPELIARVRAVLRRTTDISPHEKIKVRNIEIDAAGHRVYKDGEIVGLTATEFKVLLMLAHHAGQVMSREQLLDEVWEYDYSGDSRVVDMAIKRVREKVEDDPSSPVLIQTVRGVGYRLEAG
jgi:two-component system response regulator MtrA